MGVAPPGTASPREGWPVDRTGNGLSESPPLRHRADTGRLYTTGVLTTGDPHRMRLLAIASSLVAAPVLAFAQAQPATAAPPPALATPAPATSATAAVTDQPLFASTAKANVPVLGKWSTTLYGFSEADLSQDSTQALSDLPGNAVLSHSGTYAASHERTTFTVRNSRVGLKIVGPVEGDVRTSGVVETDFFGNQPPGLSEGGFFTSPLLRIRHFYLKVEDPVVDLVAGQTWSLFGFQPYFHPNTTIIQGAPGQVYSRTPQLRLSKTMKGSDLTLVAGAALLRSPQRDSGTPDGQAGLLLAVNDWRGVRTAGGTGTEDASAAIAVSGALRQFTVGPQAAGSTTSGGTTNGWGVSVDGFIPIIPRTIESRANALTLTGSFVSGAGDNDMYTGLTGGIGAPAPGGFANGVSGPGNNPGGIDAGFVAFDPAGKLQAIKWQSWIAGLQYFLPGNGRFWLSLNASEMLSSNIASLTPAKAATGVFKQSNWYEGALWFDATASARFAIAYDRFEQTFVDGTKGQDNRVQFSAWYLF